MFEKEAKEYADEKCGTIETEEKKFCRFDWQRGAEFGYNKATLKLRNCMNCKHRDTRGHSSCKDKGIVLCSHWEMKI